MEFDKLDGVYSVRTIAPEENYPRLGLVLGLRQLSSGAIVLEPLFTWDLKWYFISPWKKFCLH